MRHNNYVTWWRQWIRENVKSPTGEEVGMVRNKEKKKG